MMTYRVFTLAVAGVLAAGGPIVGPPTAVTVSDSGVLVLRGPEAVPDPMPEAAAQLIFDLGELSRAHPDDIAYPWLDRGSGTVVLDVTTAAGQQLGRDVQPTAATAAAGPVRTRPARFSRTALERIKDEAIDLTSATTPDGEFIYRTFVDRENNRVVIVVSKATDALVAALGKRYGTDAIVVRELPIAGLRNTGRDNDTSPFWGGARITTPRMTCSDGIPWQSGSSYMMLTAGHCIPSGGAVYTPAVYLGGVSNASEESYNVGVGTVLMTGETEYRGDIALIRIANGSSAVGRIYRGGPGSGSSALVANRLTRRSDVGDKFCVSGYRTGETCNYTVQGNQQNVRVGNETVRNVVKSYLRGGACPNDGDSGGAIYLVNSDGRLTVRGVMNGFVYDFLGACGPWFTDVYDAYRSMPGDIITAAS